jgi:crotonobetainyl-CoA:carnitine CoA-transferase CaiB-like acyl-CoA transferase
MDEDHWLTDPRFKDDLARGDHGELLSERTSEWAAMRTTEEALAELEKARIPAGAVNTPQQALDDPHIAAMGYLQPMDFPGLPGPAPIMETPVRLSETPGTLHLRAPLLGEHTDSILADLGYSPTQIEAFRAEGVV